MPGLNLDQLRQVISHVKQQIAAYTRIQEGLRSFQAVSTQRLFRQRLTREHENAQAALKTVAAGLDMLIETLLGERQVYLDMQKKILSQAESGIVTPAGPLV